jgi:hypothetical protein
MRIALALATLLALGLATAACHVVHVGSEQGPPRIESKGLIDGHVAVGVPAEDHVLHADLSDGSSPGTIGEITVWKLFRLEVGLAGLSIGLGPLQAGLGVLFYSPEVPELEEPRSAETSEPPTDDAVPSEASAPAEEG